MAIPQYAMAHDGSSSIILAKTFSASSYSNECNRATAGQIPLLPSWGI
jgi:hypothetical protein